MDLTKEQSERVVAMKAPMLEAITKLNHDLFKLGLEDAVLAQVALHDVIVSLLKSASTFAVGGTVAYGWSDEMIYNLFIKTADELDGMKQDCLKACGISMDDLLAMLKKED